MRGLATPVGVRSLETRRCTVGRHGTGGVADDEFLLRVDFSPINEQHDIS